MQAGAAAREQLWDMPVSQPAGITGRNN